MEKRKQESGIIIIFLMFAVALMIFGYVVINNILKSREANDIKDSASQAIDAAQNSVDTVNQVKDKAQSLIRN